MQTPYFLSALTHLIRDRLVCSSISMVCGVRYKWVYKVIIIRVASSSSKNFSCRVPSRESFKTGYLSAQDFSISLFLRNLFRCQFDIFFFPSQLVSHLTAQPSSHKVLAAMTRSFLLAVLWVIRLCNSCAYVCMNIWCIWICEGLWEPLCEISVSNIAGKIISLMIWLSWRLPVLKSSLRNYLHLCF